MILGAGIPCHLYALPRVEVCVEFALVESQTITATKTSGITACHKRALFEFGTPLPSDKKRNALGDMKLVADGKDIHLAILDVADDECGLFVIPTGELWGGIPKSKLVKFVKSCLDDSSQK